MHFRVAACRHRPGLQPRVIRSPGLYFERYRSLIVQTVAVADDVAQSKEADFRGTF
ncbi:MAG: hypothetical protein IIC58_04400 [Proteobacteria bacterium]|nr:hypothetical protein [Pseudomonadota bacterium]